MKVIVRLSIKYSKNQKIVVTETMTATYVYIIFTSYLQAAVEGALLLAQLTPRYLITNYLLKNITYSPVSDCFIFPRSLRIMQLYCSHAKTIEVFVISPLPSHSLPKVTKIFLWNRGLYFMLHVTLIPSASSYIKNKFEKQSSFHSWGQILQNSAYFQSQ